MTSGMDILNAVNRLLVAACPSVKSVNLKPLPDNFERPCLYLGVVGDESEDVNIDTVLERLSLIVVYFAPQDGYGVPDPIDQRVTMECIGSVFRRGYIRVGDRALRVGYKERQYDGEVGASLYFEYCDDRPEMAEEYEIMKDLYLKREV